jgi:glycosyltransferase involved in cell wall biosynthesis
MISCIIPTRDRCNLLKRAIDSVINQNSNDIEIIVVDDGSIDNTFDLVNRTYPFIKIVKTNGIGPGPARNAGVEAASCDILMFLDSDDEWLPGHANTLSMLIDKGFEAAYGVTRTVDQINGGEFMIPEDGIGSHHDCFYNLSRWCSMVPSSVAVTRKAFEEAGGFDPHMLGEDWVFFLKISSKFSFAFSQQVITRRYLHEGSLCCENKIYRKIINTLEIIREVLASIERFDSNNLEFFDQAKQIVIKEGKQWRTFQEFYVALRNHRMI